MTTHQSNILEGKTIAAGIREEIKSFAKNAAMKPKLVAIQVGNDPSSEWYVSQQEKWAEKLGLSFERVTSDKTQNQKALLIEIEKANKNAEVHGIFITMPLPEGFDSDEALLAMDPRKDVEGIHPTSLGLIVLRKSKLIPPTAYAAFKLIEATGVELRGKKATIVGQSAIVGRPLQLLLGAKRVTTTVCNTGTSEEEMIKAISESDIVIGCAGAPKMIKGEWIKQGAIVIDVGTTEVDGKLVGDIDFESAKEKASFITPVPGGVGPLTVTMLMQNLIDAYKWQQ